MKFTDRFRQFYRNRSVLEGNLLCPTLDKGTYASLLPSILAEANKIVQFARRIFARQSLPKYFMQQNFLILTRELASMKRREAAGYTTYSPILIDDRPVAMVKFMAENATPPATLQMTLIEKAENASLPLFLIRWDEESMWFHVTPCNHRAGVHLTAATWLSVDELLQLFDYCRYR